LRFFALENIPGILGDEAWGFAQVHAYLRDLPYTFAVPSGRILNPLYAAIIFIFHSGEPFYMRLVSVAIGIITIISTFILFKRIYGKQTAAIITLLFACFPLHIHYSRLAWDCCLIPIFALTLSYLILQQQTLIFLFILLLSYWVHPSLIFFIVPAFFVFLQKRKEEKKPLRWELLIPGVIGLGSFAFVYMSLKQLPLYLPYPPSVGRFIYGLLDFMTGTIMSLQIPDNRIYFIAPFGIFLAVLCWLGRKVLSSTEKVFFVGIAVTFALLFVTRGVWPVLPGFERSVLYAGAPLCLFLGLIISRVDHAKVLALGTGSFYLIVVFLFLFDPHISGRSKFIQSRTGPEDPKYSAVRWVYQQKPSGSICIIAEAWGIYWSSYNFLLAKFPGPIDMHSVNEQVGFDPKKSINTYEEFEKIMDTGGYAIGFRGGNIERYVQELTLKGRRYSRIGFKEYSGDDFIYVWIREK
jgi:hypothetical protein